MTNYNNSGISLISLIITIIVTIILASIVIFSGLATPEKARLAKFATDIDNVQTASNNAYYDKATEVALKGEVWSEAQLYEYVATGIDDRSQLNNGGIIPIDEQNNKLNMTLPKYENCRWGIALENISSTIYAGDIVLVPGIKLDETIYSSKNDIGANIGSAGSSTNEGLVFTNPYSLPTYIQEDKLKVGDYVTYTPTIATASAEPEETGMNSSQTITTSANTTWRIIYIDKEKNEVYITPTSVVSASPGLSLGGLIAFDKGSNVLHRVCNQLYNNTSLGVTVRSMTEEDVNKICNYTTKTANRYAIYPNGTSVSGTIEYNGNEYLKVAHAASPSNPVRIYKADSGETPYTDEDGYTYYIPTAEHPVFLTEYFYTLNPSSLNPTFANILTSTYGWVANGMSMYYRTGTYQCVMVSGRMLRANRYAGCGFFNSVNAEYQTMSGGLRPVVIFNNSHSIDRNFLTRDGSSAEKAWVFTK